ncbi:MAG: ribosome-recycling factor [Metamycoplasmataceae bacterium]
MEWDLYKLEFIEKMDEINQWFENQLTRITVAGANPELFKNLKINYFGSLSSLIDLCSINHAENQQLLIKPYDRKIAPEIISVIEKQNYSISIQDEGHQIRIIFPMLTRERRIEETKKISKIKEEAKIKVRNVRHSILKNIKLDKELSEDLLKLYQNKIQILVDKETEKINNLSELKEKDLLNN